MGLIKGAAKLGAAAVVIKMGSDALEKHEDKKAQRQQQPQQQQSQYPQQQQQQYPQQMNFARPRSQSPMPRSVSPGHASWCNGSCGGLCVGNGQGQAARAIEQAPVYAPEYEGPRGEKAWSADKKA